MWVGSEIDGSMTLMEDVIDLMVENGEKIIKYRCV